VSSELHVVGVARERFQRGALGSVAHDHEHGIGHGLSHQRHRSNQTVDAFTRFEATDAQHRAPIADQRAWAGAGAPKIVDIDPVGHDLVVAGEVRRHGPQRRVRHRDSRTQPSHERSQGAFPEAIQSMAGLTVHVERADERRARGGEDEPRHERRQRLVNVDDIEGSAR